MPSQILAILFKLMFKTTHLTSSWVTVFKTLQWKSSFFFPYKCFVWGLAGWKLNFILHKIRIYNMLGSVECLSGLGAGKLQKSDGNKKELK